MGFTFTATQPDAHKIEVPFFEDARAQTAPFYASNKSIEVAQREVRDYLGKLKAEMVMFIEGEFTDGTATRYGYEIRFSYQGAQGLIRVAGLPMRRANPQKKKKVLVQALLNVREWVKAAITGSTFSPGMSPLVGFLLVPGNQNQTLQEWIVEKQDLPNLNPASESRLLDDGELKW